MSEGAPMRCGRCDKMCYHAEGISMAGKRWHKSCFACAEVRCRKKLESTNCCEGNGDIWCKSCYARNFGQRGYGFGLGAGTLSMDTGKYGEAPPNMAPKVWFPTKKENFELKEGICPACGNEVFEAEKVACNNNVYHKQCFACFNCKSKLESTTVNDHESGIYCPACYAKNYGALGYGYGVGAGALKLTGK
ncbi:cysteine and glycine-rich protein 1 [Nematostella vectensis]|uniref:Cysteine and glycine-rich protein n=1 Tax=Nematostella vectensis TaxID=45351 RepID=I2G9D7_NEMVE|nr:cysteine and glycine-rich protein 1 [Nematostella vectensis]CCH23121.1 cysteine and glycine-rich protein [Nematostella vectensis]